MKLLLSMLLGFASIQILAEDISFRAEMILGHTDISSMDNGETLWEQDYMVLSGEPVKLSYIHEDGQVHTFVLALSLPQNAAWGSQKLSIHGYWDVPSGSVDVIGDEKSGLTVEGELALTLFQDETTNRGVHLRVTPRVNWEQEDKAGKSVLPLFPLENAFVLFNDQVIARNLHMMGHRFQLRDGDSIVATLSATPFPDHPQAARFIPKDGRIQILGPNWRLDILNGTTFEPSTALYVSFENPGALYLEDPLFLPVELN